MKHIHIGIISLLILTLFSCIHDDTVTEFKELNEVEISGIKPKYVAVMLDTLKINPVLQTSQNDSTNLSYVWYLHQTNAAMSKDTISYGKNLDVQIKPQFVIPGLEYTLVYKVTDETTGVYYREETSLEVVTPYSKGTLFLCREDDKVEVNFLSQDEDRTLLEDIFQRANEGMEIGSNPLNIYAINPNKYRTYMKTVMITCEDENGGVYADPLTFQFEKHFRDGFEKTPDVPTMSTLFYKKHGQIEYIVMNGQLRKRATNSGASKWEIPCICLDGEPDYEMAPFVLDFTTGIFYDQKHQRFLIHQPYNKGVLYQLDADESGKAVFDPNHVGDNLQLLAWGPESGDIARYFMLMKNTETGKLFIYKFQLMLNITPWSTTINFVSRQIVELNGSIAPNIANAHTFATNPNFMDILMYADKDKVYSLNVRQITGGNVAEGLQIDMASQNKEITGFEFLTIDVPIPTENNPERTRESNQLRVFVKDNSLEKLKGGFSFYEVTTTGGLHSNEILTRTGFCDEVVDSDEKYD